MSDGKNTCWTMTGWAEGQLCVNKKSISLDCFLFNLVVSKYIQKTIFTYPDQEL